MAHGPQMLPTMIADIENSEELEGIVIQ
ncbi:uncharacterized protein G2W53_019315 [Senna tora]|uniref:Uncharacterized protein n=1 Tax=Senna tora TaxID=362788 RepID=A0A834TWT2_9FABA|nr:uncharacterized protein G2W53_019315 [Senna tora]